METLNLSRNKKPPNSPKTPNRKITDQKKLSALFGVFGEFGG
jgi:hypothetical protein